MRNRLWGILFANWVAGDRIESLGSAPKRICDRFPPLRVRSWDLNPGLARVLVFDSHVADASDEIVGGRLAFFHGHDLHRISVIVGTKNQVSARKFHIFHGTTAIFAHGVHIGFAFSVGLERIVVAVNEDGCARQKAGVHTHTFPAIPPYDHETFPFIAVALA